MADQTPFSFSRSGRGASVGAPIQISVPAEEIARLRNELTGRAAAVPKALSGAINKTLASTRTRIVEGIRERITAKRGNVFKRTSIEKASPSNLSGRVVIQGKRIGLINFQHRSSRTQGVSVTLYQGGPVLRFRHAFLGIGASGNQQIFERQPGAARVRIKRPHYRPNLGRLTDPIRAFYGLSLRRLFDESPDFVKQVQDAAEAQLPAEIDSQILRFANLT